MKRPTAAEKKTGTREWSDSSLNVCAGCPNGCLYCYAREMALRYGRIADGAAWTAETVDQAKLDDYRAVLAGTKKIRGGLGTVMIPTTHDITPKNAEAVAAAACALLSAPTPPNTPETRILFVTKADGPSVETVCRKIDEIADQDQAPLGTRGILRNRTEWRLTIGALDDRARAFWEPHAPPVEMRLEVLRWLYRTAWRTSVSAEPLLEPRRAVALVTTVAPHVTETVWIGTARDLARRTAWTKNAPAFRYTAGRLAKAIANLEAWQTDGGILAIAQQLRDELGPDVWPKVRFKDSYTDILARYGWTFSPEEPGRPVQTETRPAAAFREESPK